MDTQDAGSAGQLEPQGRRERGQRGEYARLIQDAPGPSDSSRHGRVALHEVLARHCVGGRRVRGGLLARQYVAVGDPQRATVRIRSLMAVREDGAPSQ